MQVVIQDIQALDSQVTVVSLELEEVDTQATLDQVFLDIQDLVVLDSLVTQEFRVTQDIVVLVYQATVDFQVLEYQDTRVTQVNLVIVDILAQD